MNQRLFEALIANRGNLCLLDIETRATEDPQTIERVRSKVKPPGNMRKADTIERWWQTDGWQAQEEAVRRTSLDYRYGHICSIGIRWNGLNRTLAGDSEPDLLDALGSWVGGAEDEGVLVTWNGADFDLPWLLYRSAVHDYRWTSVLTWNHIDVMDLLSGHITKKLAMDVVAGSWGLSERTRGRGADVQAFYEKGDLSAIEMHNGQDLVVLEAIVKRLLNVAGALE